MFWRFGYSVGVEAQSFRVEGGGKSYRQGASGFMIWVRVSVLKLDLGFQGLGLGPYIGRQVWEVLGLGLGVELWWEKHDAIYGKTFKLGSLEMFLFLTEESQTMSIKIFQGLILDIEQDVIHFSQNSHFQLMIFFSLLRGNLLKFRKQASKTDWQC